MDLSMVVIQQIDKLLVLVRESGKEKKKTYGPEKEQGSNLDN